MERGKVVLISKRQGITLLELLVAMVITLIVLSAAYFTYINLLKGFKGETVSIGTQMERLIGLEILRLDVEHAGYGISTDETSPIIAWSGSSRTLTVRSTVNSANENTIGWALIDCSGAGSAPSKISGDTLSNNQTVVFLTLSKSFKSNGLYGQCPDSGKFLVFPYDSSVSNGCSQQYCNSIAFRLSSSQNLKTCNPNTRNLLRVVGNGNGMPVLNCVADFQVRFDYDSNGDGKIDNSERNLNLSSFTGTNCSGTNDCLRKNLKRVSVYILVQEGKFDRSYSFTGSTSVDNVTLSLPQDYTHYRWKVVKLSVKPMNL